MPVVGGIDTIYYSVYIHGFCKQTLKLWIEHVEYCRKRKEVVLKDKPFRSGGFNEPMPSVAIFPPLKGTNYKAVVGTDDFRIGMFYTESTRDRSSPLYVLLSSKFLMENGYQDCISKVRIFIEKILELEITAEQLSRLDLYCDSDEIFLSERHLKYFIRTSRDARFHKPRDDDKEEFVIQDVAGYEKARVFTGFTFGQRNKSIFSRVYLKKAEIRKSEKNYLFDWWKEHGLNIDRDIWRVEFELHRSQLKDLGFTEFSQLDSEALNILWEYLTTKVLRFIQTPNKDHTERTKPRRAWRKIQNVRFNVKERFRVPDRLPQRFDELVAQVVGLLSKISVSYSKSHNYTKSVDLDFCLDIIKNYYSDELFKDKVREKENELAFTNSILERYFEKINFDKIKRLG